MEKGKIVVIEATGVKAEIIKSGSRFINSKTSQGIVEGYYVECLTTSKEMFVLPKEIKLYKLTGVA